MNVNGARFQLLLGKTDWGRCMDDDGHGAMPLSVHWKDDARPPTSPPSNVPSWDAVRDELTLQPQPIDLKATATETAFTLQSRRGAAADRNGNIYRVADDGRILHVLSAGSGRDSLFWPVPDKGRSTSDSFHLHDTEAPEPAEDYLGLVVTADDYLVVAYVRGKSQRGLLSFDLIAGGPPNDTAWPASVSFTAIDLCKREGGGLWLLDQVAKHLWELDCNLAVVRSGQPLTEVAEEAADDFQPLGGAPRKRHAQQFPGGLDLKARYDAVNPIAIDTLADGSLLVLDRDALQKHSRVLRLQRKGGEWSCQDSGWLDRMPAPAHDLLVAEGASFQQAAPMRVWITTTIGNQAHAWHVDLANGGFKLRPATELFPLRRHAGRALVSVQGRAFYDSGPTTPLWTQIVQQPQARYAEQATLVTPVFDSADLGTVWDKLLIDACIPAGTELKMESRAGDEVEMDGSPAEARQVVGIWSSEPALRLRSDGPELPWLRREAARATKRDSGTGTWELLLQNAQGRYAQLRLTLISSNGTGTPRLRALRLWSPRFSYLQRFLPAVYREDPANGHFLERWLANFESTLTQMEDRVAQVQALFDARSTPAEMLPWLAEWMDLALDPAWDERRHRLFLQHAMDFFRWRGTLHGLRLALSLAFDPCINDSAFDTPQAAALDDNAGPNHIRIVEAYQTRLIGALAAGDAGAVAEGPRVVPLQALWTPAEGNAGLADRWARWQNPKDGEATPLQQITAFALVPPTPEPGGAITLAALQQAWSDFCTATLGFVPAVGAAERARWQAFLATRYADEKELNGKHGSTYASMAAVALPADLSTNTTAAADWREFCARSQAAWARGRWQDFLARRYRRIEKLQRAHRVAWDSFDTVPLPDVLPATAEAQTDWLQFEGQLLAMHRTAHRFSVLLPVASVISDPSVLEQRLGLARRIVELEKPAHTVFDVRFFWAFNRIGEARLGLDTQLGAGSRASELVPDAVLGRAYLGASFVGGPARPKAGDRLLVDC